MPDLRFIEMEFEDFKSFRGKHSFTLDHAPGLYFVTGRNQLEPELGANGAGKSTLWDVLIWTMFGRTVRDSRPANSVASWDSDGSCFARVTLQRGEEAVSIRRSRKPNGLMIDNKEVQQQEIYDLLGLTDSIFMRTVVLGQFGDLFLDLTPERQSQMFTEVLQLDLWLTASKRAAEQSREHELERERQERSLAMANGRVEELTRQIETETFLSRSFAKGQADAIRELKLQAAGVKRMLETLIAKAPPKPKEPGGSNGKGTAAGREALAAVQAREAALEKEIRESYSRLSLASKNASRLQAEIRDYDKIIASSKRVCPACGQKVSLDHLKGKQAELAEQLTALDTEGRLHEKTYKSLTRERELLARDIKSREAELDKERWSYADAVNKHTAFERERSDLQGKITVIEAKIGILTDQENTHEKTLADMKKALGILENQQTSLKKQIKQCESGMEAAGFWKDAFKEIRLNQIDKALAELEIMTNSHAEALGLIGWKIEFKTEKERASGAVSNTFTVLLYPPGSEEPVRWEAYSGGEVQRWQLAVLFALSEILLGRAGISPNIEILDEPTRHMSPQGVDYLLESLKERARDSGKAIYFTDHASYDAGYFDGVITVEKTEAGSKII